MSSLYSVTIFGSSAYEILWLLAIYSFLGVLVETLFCLVNEGVLESRTGLLYLPLRPIYGVGGTVCTVVLEHHLEWPLLTFGVGMLVGSVVEYVAACIVSFVFGTTTWDYSTKPFNLHGRICLEFAIYWGLLTMFVLYGLNGVVDLAVNSIPRPVGELVLSVLVVLTMMSFALTGAAFARIRRQLQRAAHRADVANTPRWERLIVRLAPDPVMIHTFPQCSVVKEYVSLSGSRCTRFRVTEMIPGILGSRRQIRIAATAVVPVNRPDSCPAGPRRAATH